jgi:Tfp pilus assembly protein PilF
LKVKWVPIILIIVLMSACSVHNVSQSEFDFANKLAKQGLWKESLYRWEKALKAGNVSVAIYNNIAVAQEELGRFEESEKSYQKALNISPGHATVQANYDRLKKLLKKSENEKK